MDVWISIKGIQNADGEDHMMELDTAGIMEKTGEGYKLVYQESETTGMEGVTTSMYISPSAVTLERRVSMNSLMVLEKGRRTVCNYDTGYGNIMMGIYTCDLSTDMTDDGGEFRFHYTLDINSGMASSHDVHITVRKTDDNPIATARKRRPLKKALH